MAVRSRFSERVVLVTGASSGIGRATAQALGAEGARVVAAGRRQDRLDRTAADIRSAGGEAIAVTGDVRDEGVCQSWVESAARTFGCLDGLVNAAGVIGSSGLLDTSLAEWDRLLDSNLPSVFVLSRAAASVLIKLK